MTDYMTIVKATAGTTGFESTQATPTLTTIRSYFGLLEVTRPTVRFDGVTITPISSHIWYIPYEQDIYELDLNSLYVKLEGSKERIFKLDKIEIYDESNQWLLLYLVDKGFSENYATWA
jgi:hypothetical protein